jgi:ComF family protein
MRLEGLTDIANGFLDIIYPPKCVGCGNLGASYLCKSCIARIEPVPRPYCQHCGQVLTDGGCRACRDRAKSFTTARAAGQYSGVLRQAIHAFKYGGARVLAEPLAQFLHIYLKTHSDFPWEKCECIVGVPIHPARKRVRGYNQSELLADSLGTLLGLPVVMDSVVRNRQTRPQVELTSDERRTNMRNAFSLGSGCSVKGRAVLLLDDVTTTGSTIHECSAILLKAGAAKVYVLCLALDV